MSSQTRPGRWVGAGLLLLLTAGLAPVVYAQPSTTGPIITLDPGVVELGDPVLMTIDGFLSSSVTVSVCGNEARRGSTDCNMAASEGIRLEPDGSTIAQMPVAAPPVPCPCVLRVSNRTNDEVAIAAIVITDHPSGPVEDGPRVGTPLAVTITAVEASAGPVAAIRSNLGGPANYDVTVTVKNTSTVPLRTIAASGSAGRGADDYLLTLELDDPGEIAPGQTWRQTVRAVVPAPSFGTVQWRVNASGAGPSVAASATTEHRPIMLMIVCGLLVVDVFLLVIRWRIRRRAAQAAEALLTLA